MSKIKLDNILIYIYILQLPTDNFIYINLANINQIELIPKLIYGFYSVKFEKLQKIY